TAWRSNTERQLRIKLACLSCLSERFSEIRPGSAMWRRSARKSMQTRLGTDHAAIAQIHLGLVAHDELVALDGTAQLALEHESFDRRRIHLRRIEGVGVAAVLL